jgi:hypothetical protein
VNIGVRTFAGRPVTREVTAADEEAVHKYRGDLERTRLEKETPLLAIVPVGGGLINNAVMA